MNLLLYPIKKKKKSKANLRREHINHIFYNLSCKMLGILTSACQKTGPNIWKLRGKESTETNPQGDLKIKVIKHRH